MKIDITSMFFNSKIEGQTATPAWGTSIGQNKSKECRIDDFKKEIVDMVIGMTYKSIANMDKLDISKGSSDRDILICSVFDSVYVNNIKLEKTQYTLLLVREHSKSHEGRLLISYAPYIDYNGIQNQSCIDKMQKALGCTPDGCWFVYDITIRNQSELHFKAVVVDAQSPKVYSAIKSKNRSEEWKNLIPVEDNLEIKTNLQQIFYGAPGTGKSFEIKQQTQGKEVIRTTFHPDSDYSTFVGAYKPTSIEVPLRDLAGHIVNDEVTKMPVMDNRILYEFVDQAFLKAYIGAWKKIAEAESIDNAQEQYLVVEEINRGNCAQIFGDLFQLLDRNKSGFSEYPISADNDMRKHLKDAFEGLNIAEGASIDGMYDEPVVEKVLNGEILLLPGNLYIWATMNTSDQSLFPIDSAFKRRWEWKYIPIADGGKNWTIEVNNQHYDWWQFVTQINKEIYELTHSEDKQLGYYFCKAEEDVVSAETFVGKVLFYLWNDVFKDGDDVSNIFSIDADNVMRYPDFYTTTDDKKTGVNASMVELLLKNLGLEPITSATPKEEEVDDEEDEDGNTPTSKGRNYDKFSVNGNGAYGKNTLPTEAMKEYIRLHPEQSADEVVDAWKSLGKIVPHFVESKAEYDARTDSTKHRSSEIPCSGTIIYVVRNGYGSNRAVDKLVDAINNQDWGVKLAKVE